NQPAATTTTATARVASAPPASATQDGAQPERRRFRTARKPGGARGTGSDGPRCPSPFLTTAPRASCSSSGSGVGGDERGLNARTSLVPAPRAAAAPRSRPAPHPPA